MIKSDLVKILERESTLNTVGFGLGNCRSLAREEYRTILADNRESLLADLETCSLVAKWLRENAQERKSINKDCFSYRWKHIVEAEIGCYVSNGAFIAAAIYCGFNYRPESPESPNALFNICTYRAKTRLV